MWVKEWGVLGAATYGILGVQRSRGHVGPACAAEFRVLLPDALDLLWALRWRLRRHHWWVWWRGGRGSGWGEVQDVR